MEGQLAPVETYLATLRAARGMLQDGVKRGELRKDADLELVLDALYGPLYYRLLIKHAPLTQHYADALVDLVFAGIEQN